MRGLHRAGGGIDVAFKVELDVDLGAAGGAERRHLDNAGDGAELPLQRLRHGGGDGVGAGARQTGPDADGRAIDVRQGGDRQTRIGDDAQQQQRPTASSVVATGRRMNGAERFMPGPIAARPAAQPARQPRRRRDRSPASCRASGTAKPAVRRRSRCPSAAAVPSRCRCRAPAAGRPSSAAIVVIMIGRKRRMQAWRIASQRRRAALAFRLQREIHHHDGVLLDDADQQDDADQARSGRDSWPHSISASSAPTPAEGKVERIVMGWMKLS